MAASPVGPAPSRTTPGRARIPLSALFRGFLLASLNAFGGGLNAHLLNLVRREGWLADQEFAEFSTFAQTLPGSNNGNLSALLGYQLRGVPGAAVALTALLLPGSLLMAALAGAYFGGSLATDPHVSGALQGAAAAALGIGASAGLNVLRFTLTHLQATVVAVLTCLLALFVPGGTVIALAVLLPLGVLFGRST
ncbi:chromate transporter [Deinococcus aquiradiocola]|nr:chromate transporter [Deinococcus aquiradiocola]